MLTGSGLKKLQKIMQFNNKINFESSTPSTFTLA